MSHVESMERSPKEQHLLNNLISSISHHMLGILGSIRLKNSIVLEALPSLIEGYQLAISNQLTTPQVKERHLKMLNEMTDIGLEVQEVIGLCTTVNHFCNEMIALPSTRYTILDRVRLIISLNKAASKELITIDDKINHVLSFSFTFFDALIQNLIENALHAVTKNGAGTISIWLSEEEQDCVLHIKDTGIGMNEHQCLATFDRFLSKRSEKILPGLGFCREALRRLGGDIRCESEMGQFTHFRIVLPS